MVATTNKRVRFANNNQVSNLDAANITASSALSSFPFSHTQSDARFRAWKPAGNFTMTATNNLIYFTDSGDKTATITAGDYTYTTLAVEIAAQLDATGDDTDWVCTYSLTTRKFTISNSNNHSLRFSETTNAAWDTLGYTGTGDIGQVTHLAEESRNHTHESVIYDLGSPKAVDFFALIGFVGENLTISDQATITLKGNSTPVFTSPPISKTPTHTENGLFYYEDTDDMTYRYWEFKFADRLNTVGPEGFNICHLYLGDYDTMTNTNIAQGFQESLIDPTVVKKSDAGSKFFRLKSKYASLKGLQINNLSQAERVILKTFFQDKGISEPFYVSIDPTQAASATIDELTKFVHFEGNPSINHVFLNTYSISFALSEVI